MRIIPGKGPAVMKTNHTRFTPDVDLLNSLDQNDKRSVIISTADLAYRSKISTYCSKLYSVISFYIVRHRKFSIIYVYYAYLFVYVLRLFLSANQKAPFRGQPKLGHAPV